MFCVRAVHYVLIIFCHSHFNGLFLSFPPPSPTAKCHIAVALNSPVLWCLWLNQNPSPIHLLEYQTTTVVLSKGTWGTWLACTFQVVIPAKALTRGPILVSNSTILVELFPSLISEVWGNAPWTLISWTLIGTIVLLRLYGLLNTSYCLLPPCFEWSEVVCWNCLSNLAVSVPHFLPVFAAVTGHLKPMTLRTIKSAFFFFLFSIPDILAQASSLFLNG